MTHNVFSRRQTAKNILIAAALATIVALVAMYASHAEAAGVVRSGKTGAHASVGNKYAARFQAYVDDLEAAGATVFRLGGYRPGHCSIPRHKHPCGMALDVCQTGRGRVEPRCHLPGAQTIAVIAARHGLVEGGIWCHSDYGHAEIRTAQQAEACGNNMVASARRHRNHQYAAAQPAEPTLPGTVP